MATKVKTITLEDYPALLNELGQRILEIENMLYGHRLNLEQLDSEHEYAIAFDETLRNDQQRKAALKRLRQELTYQSMQATVQATLTTLKEAELLREQRLNEFSLAKLAKRYQIANLEMQGVQR